jgi:hypothetical protein
MTKLFAVAFALFLPFSFSGKIKPQSSPCGSTTITVSQTIDKTSVNPGDAMVETVTISNAGTAQGIFTIVDRLEDFNEVYDLTTHMDTVILDAGKSRTLYRIYAFPCSIAAGVYTINNRTISGGPYNPVCITNNATFNITSTNTCAGG